MKTKFHAKVIACITAATAATAVTAGPGHAAQQQQDGLVNVAIGDITIQDINVGVAAQVAAAVCGLKVGPVAVLGRAVDRSGTTDTVCTVGNEPIDIIQN